ncbi:unnamed protein product [Rhizoctonia solani]|uniref:F-box domain-containing protein n=1 Tax=Rhizoctonia solani TaxID=456999 RepID=A0A8H3DWC6_9AGAM|nr:unnamed protein product [Rhizoctonia solani]
MFKSLAQSSSPSTIREWEDAGASLAATLENYLNLCYILPTRSLQEGTHPKDLATRIDHALETFQFTIDQNIALARSTLSRSRNQIMSPIGCFPEEVLIEIFSRVIYTPPDPSEPTPMEESLVKMYRSLHSLLGVCTTWRNIALHHKPFWSTVPVIDLSPSALAPTFTQATELSLERSGNLDLHLAVIRSEQCHGRSISAVFDHASRFRTVNLTAKTQYAVRLILEPFLKLEVRELSDLSIRLQQRAELSNAIPPDYDYISSPAYDPSYHNHLNIMLNELSVLRLYGTLVHFDNLAFSDKLVKLHIQGVTLGWDVEIAKLMQALSSATQLRDLRIISVTTFLDHAAIPNISLPNLQYLLVQDLYNNTMRQILESISTRSHDLTVHLTYKCLMMQDVGQPAPEGVDTDDLHDILSQVSVHALLIDGEDEWLDWVELETMMQRMSDLKSLRLHYWDFDEESSGALKRSRSDPNQPSISLPALENIHISWARIWGEEGFKNMVASYSDSLRRMVLGAASSNSPRGKLNSLKGDEDLVSWLKANVPEFELTDNTYNPPEFQPLEWELW